MAIKEIRYLEEYAAPPAMGGVPRMPMGMYPMGAVPSVPDQIDDHFRRHWLKYLLAGGWLANRQLGRVTKANNLMNRHASLGQDIDVLQQIARDGKSSEYFAKNPHLRGAFGTDEEALNRLISDKQEQQDRLLKPLQKAAASAQGGLFGSGIGSGKVSDYLDSVNAKRTGMIIDNTMFKPQEQTTDASGQVQAPINNNIDVAATIRARAEAAAKANERGYTIPHVEPILREPEAATTATAAPAQQGPEPGAALNSDYNGEVPPVAPADPSGQAAPQAADPNAELNRANKIAKNFAKKNGLTSDSNFHNDYQTGLASGMSPLDALRMAVRTHNHYKIQTNQEIADMGLTATNATSSNPAANPAAKPGVKSPDKSQVQINRENFTPTGVTPPPTGVTNVSAGQTLSISQLVRNSLLMDNEDYEYTGADGNEEAPEQPKKKKNLFSLGAKIAGAAGLAALGAAGIHQIAKAHHTNAAAYKELGNEDLSRKHQAKANVWNSIDVVRHAKNLFGSNSNEE